tara:strand:+ start:94 stop:549 length:456 start_codon:yes stop_codon:yes gene_type:complete
MSAPKTFRMDTNTFVRLWHKAITDDNDWKTFCVAIFIRFTTGWTGSANTNIAYLDHPAHHHKDWQKWSEDEQYEFISDKVYRKCGTIRRNVKKRIMEERGITSKSAIKLMAEERILSYPSGVSSRPGTGNATGTRALSPDEILALWKRLPT